MPNLDEALELITLAEEDANSLLLMLKLGQLPQRICGFHAQQAVEKALKSWLSLLDIEYPLAHSLQALLSLLSNAGVDCKEYEELEALTPYAVRMRYAMEVTEGKVNPASLSDKIVHLVKHVRTLIMTEQEKA